MDELADTLEFGVAGDLLLEQILDRLYIVVGGALDLLDALRIHLEKLVMIVRVVRGVGAERRHLGDVAMVAASDCSQRISTITR